MTALKPLGSAQREISLRHSLFEEAIALVRNSAVGVLVTAIQVIAGSACRNFSTPDLSAFEHNYILIILIINGISIAFDINDTVERLKGNRDVAGFPGEPVRF